jgi:uncharacterized protein
MFIGALNWGLIGFFNVDFIAALFGINTVATSISYAIVGLSAIINLILGFSIIRCDLNKYTTAT